MNEDKWNEFKKIYSDMFSVPEQIPEYLAVWDIIKLTACGLSIKTTANKLCLEEEYIESVTKEFLDFVGYKLDLDINPYLMYNRSKEDYDLFNSEIKLLSPYFNDGEIKFIFEICKKCRNIEMELEKWLK